MSRKHYTSKHLTEVDLQMQMMLPKGRHDKLAVKIGASGWRL